MPSDGLAISILFMVGLLPNMQRFQFPRISSDCLGRSVLAHRIQLWRNELYVESHSHLLRNILMHRLEGSSPQTIALVTIGGMLLILVDVQVTYLLFLHASSRNVQ